MKPGFLKDTMPLVISPADTYENFEFRLVNVVVESVNEGLKQLHLCGQASVPTGLRSGLRARSILR